MPRPAGVGSLALAHKAALPIDVVTNVANNAEPFQLNQREYPNLTRASAEQVLETFCGTVTDVARATFRTINGLSKSADLTQPLGPQAFAVHFPACLYLSTKPVQVTVQKDASLSDLFLAMTGRPGNRKTILSFFQRKSGRVQPGDRVTGAFVSRPSRIIPKSGFSLMDLLGASPAAAAVYVPSPAATAAPERNRIIVARSAGKDGDPYVPPAECTKVGPFSLSVERLRNALTLSDAVQDNNKVSVLVADNGFLGAQAQNGHLVFNGHFFDGRMFKIGTDEVTSEETLGPDVGVSDTVTLSPLLDAQAVAPITEVSGHGTHVTGLVVGGAALGLESGIFDMTVGTRRDSWLRTSELPLAAGTSDVSAQAAKAMTQIGLFFADIVNLSVRYGSGSQTDFIKLFRDRNDTLFVAAAGNDTRQVLSKSSGVESNYPAALGGPTSPNVITVAAEDGEGNLTAFTNIGLDHVDLASPGCNLVSWLDGTRAASLSGTSQAAPITTLAAVLLAHKGLTTPRIKRRLLLSGDLLTGQWSLDPAGQPVLTQYTDKDAVPVASRSRLNIVKALYFPLDYIRFAYLPPGALPGTPKTIVEALGTISLSGKARCNEEDMDAKTLLAVKRSPTGGLFCFPKKALRAAVVSFYDDVGVQFTVDHALLANGTPDPAIPGGQVIPVALQDLQEFVLSDNNMTFVERQ